jgi:tRNA pseudouridine65 synthase
MRGGVPLATVDSELAPPSAGGEGASGAESGAESGAAYPSIEVLYQAADIAVVDKPAGLLTHRSAMCRERDVAMMRARNTLGRYVYPVHRLDRGTSGALAFGLSSEAAATLRTHFDEHRANKVYVALVRGAFKGDCVVDYAIPCDEGGARVAAQTRFELVAASALASVVLAYPLTGRFHQIRRHLAHLRFPIANDSNYGTGWFNRAMRERGMLRLALHAYALSVPGPAGEVVSVSAPLPEDFAAILAQLGFDGVRAALHARFAAPHLPQANKPG